MKKIASGFLLPLLTMLLLAACKPAEPPPGEAAETPPAEASETPPAEVAEAAPAKAVEAMPAPPSDVGADFEKAWVRSIPPGMKMTAGFGTLVNRLDEQIDITSVSSPGFQSVSMHRTEVVDGVSSMKEVETLPVGAGSSLAMEPGGYHLMLMGPRQRVSPGATVELEFHAADGRVFRFVVPVEKR